VRKAALQESLAALTRRIIEEQKKAAAANKEKAVAAAVEAADAAAAGGQKFLVARLEVGLDTKAIQVRRVALHCGAAAAAARQLCLLAARSLRAISACLINGLGEMARPGEGCHGVVRTEQRPACRAVPLLTFPSPCCRLPVGIHTRCPQEAWNAIQKKHPSLPVMFVSVGDDKALAYAGVPQDLSKQLSAGGWVGGRVGGWIDGGLLEGAQLLRWGQQLHQPAARAVWTVPVASAAS
jgi:hypothetical protein